MPPPPRDHLPPPPLVALASWLVPGAGYWVIGQRARALTTGVTIVALFVLGLLVGGVRALEVPGWDEDGSRVRMKANGEKAQPADHYAYSQARWVMARNPLIELRAKPWFIAQVLNGPMALAAGAWSVWASTPPNDRGPGPDAGRDAPGATSHSRVNEIGVLYTAVAGMLNLLVIIDASHRAGQPHAQAFPASRPQGQGQPVPRPEAR